MVYSDLDRYRDARQLVGEEEALKGRLTSESFYHKQFPERPPFSGPLGIESEIAQASFPVHYGNTGFDVQERNPGYFQGRDEILDQLRRDGLRRTAGQASINEPQSSVYLNLLRQIQGAQ